MKPPHRETTSDKQRRHEIKARRQQLRRERADQAAREYEAGLVSRVAAGSPIHRSAWRDQELIAFCLRSGRLIPGVELADREELVRDRGLQTEIPLFYQDRPFTCRDCGTREVWTAADQKWWHETAHGAFDSHPLFCRVCGEKRRKQSAAGANLLREVTQRLRLLGTRPPNLEAQAELAAALQSKWWGVRMVAIETLGRWGGPEQVRELKAFIAAGVEAETRNGDSPFYNSWEYAAAQQGMKVLLPLLPDRLHAASANEPTVEPTVEAMEEAQLALRNPSWCLQKAAIEALECWGGAEQVAWLQALVAAGPQEQRPDQRNHAGEKRATSRKKGVAHADQEDLCWRCRTDGKPAAQADWCPRCRSAEVAARALERIAMRTDQRRGRGSKDQRRQRARP